MAHLKEPLDAEVATIPKTIITHLPERSGLIRAKVHGANMATGDVLIYLDSHCEVNDGWIEPLLDRIKRDRTTVAMPIIDAIEAHTFEVRTAILQRGVISWGLHFYWTDVTPERHPERKSVTEPLLSPAMAGGKRATSGIRPGSKFLACRSHTETYPPPRTVCDGSTVFQGNWGV
eukprot:m.97368 g.97368  ORF g.97368 m.97368 type:complete len:175 (-) comp15219_c0_seq4:807-1331(-)